MNPMANRSAALAGAAQALKKPDFRQNLTGATNGTIKGANGGTQQLGPAAQRRVDATTAMKPPTPSIPMPPVKQPNMAGGGLNPGAPDPTTMTKPTPLPGFNPGQMTPPIFAGGQMPGQPPVNQGPDMPTIPMPGKPAFGSGAQQGVQGPGGSDQDQMQDQMHGAGPMGQFHPPGGGPTIGGMPLPGGPGDKPFFGGGDKYPGPTGSGPLPGFGGAPGVHAMPGGPDGGILSMPGGPGQISIHGSPGGGYGLPIKPGMGTMDNEDIRPDGQHPTDVWGKIAGGGGTGPRRNPMAGYGF